MDINLRAGGGVVRRRRAEEKAVAWRSKAQAEAAEESRVGRRGGWAAKEIDIGRGGR
jgi:hypothetical protein